MVEIVRALAELNVWVRLHYVYPYPHVDEVIPLMAEGKLLPYLDVPFQHASPRILRLMKRPANAEKQSFAHTKVARILSRHHDSQHFHRGISRRDRK
jgi:tRNA A37 methylthiotransferase MiaB